MAIPANYKTRQCQIDRQDNNSVLVINNTTGSNIVLDQFTVVDGRFCGVANLDSLDGEKLSITVEEGLRILTDATDAGATLDTQGAEVFFDDVNGDFTDVSAAGLYLVGLVIQPVDGNGNFTFEKFRYAEVVV